MPRMTRANGSRSVPSDRALFALSSVYALLVRLPWLGAGYGWDSDAWREASVAAAMSETGRILASRFPGNPAFELAIALVWGRSPWAQNPWVLNGLTALVAALGTGAFALLARRVGVAQPLLAALAFTSVPAFLIVSTSTLDYAWGLCFGVLGLLFAARGLGWAAGVALGIAIGARLTSTLFLGPALVLLAMGRPDTAVGGAPAVSGPRARSLLACAIAAIALGGAFYLPLWLEYGPAFLRFYDLGYPSPALLLKKATVDLWGWIGTAGIGVALVLALLARRPGGAQVTDIARPARGVMAACGLGLVLFVVAYLRLPYKPAYLLPAVPFALLLLGLVPPSTRRGLQVAAFALVLSPWVLTAYAPGKTDDPLPETEFASRWTRAIRAGGRSVVVDLRGPVPVDRARRLAGMDYGARILEASRTLPTPAIVVAQDWLPQLRMRLGDHAGAVEERGVRFVHQLSEADLDSVRLRGATIYFLPGSESTHPVRLGLDPRTEGARPLPLSP
ncbi:MAG: hypothetical protein ACREOU_11585 [Candidatus Eiseniibacteriota bacterium]